MICTVGWYRVFCGSNPLLDEFRKLLGHSLLFLSCPLCLCLGESIIYDLFYVMNHTVEEPLDIDLDLAP